MLCRWHSDTILYGMKSIVSLAFIFLMAINGLVSAHDDATHNDGFCQTAQTTADLVTCSGQHLQAESNRLKILFDRIVTLYQDDLEKLAALNDRQNEWINFRAQTCQAEANIYEGGSLARVQNISCQARMTADRSNHFISILNGFGEGDIPTFSSPPRWVNVMINDYEDVFWTFAKNVMADLDCDGVDEILVRGLKKQDDESYKHVTAVIDRHKSGKAQIVLINFNDRKNCEIANDIDVVTLPSPKPEVNDTEKTCHQAVTIKTKQCGLYALSLDIENGSYTVSPLEKEKE